MMRWITLWLSIAPILTPSVMSAQNPTDAEKRWVQSNRPYDRLWWESLYNDEKDGFLVGHEDCFIWEGKHTRARNFSFKALATRIDSFFRSPNHKNFSVLQAIDSIAGLGPWPGPKPESKSGGEVWTEPHAYLDGTWWRGGSEHEHLAFVAGYLACYSRMTAARSMKMPGEYVKGIDAFYARRVENEPEKVATVLMKLVASEKK